MGFGDEPERSSPNSSRRPSYYSEQFNAYRERQEAKARLEAWMNGREPRWAWDVQSDGWRVFVMSFPGTAHNRGVFVAEHPVEHGRILVWCEACHVADCGACRWAKSAYLAQVKAERLSSGTADDTNDGLPF